MNNKSKARRANGLVSAVIVCFFLLHAALGSLSAFAALPRPLPLVVWAGVILAGVHLVLSVATSYEQLTDTVRPPSKKKRQHLALKWATGMGLALVAAIHVWRIQTLGVAEALYSVPGTCWTIALALLLAMHIWTGSKSLLKDLNIDRRYRNVVRAVAAVCAGLFIIAALAKLLGS